MPKDSPVSLSHALVEHVPRAKAERRPHLQRHAQAVEQKTGIELHEAAGHWHHIGPRVALKSIANRDEVACMDSDRGLSGPHLARLLGEWRSSGPAYASLARAVRLLVLDGRLPLRTRLAGRARARRGARREPHDRDRRLRRAARRGLPGQPPRLRLLDAAARRPGRRARAGRRRATDVIDLSCAASAAPEGALHAALAAATAELPRHLPGPGYDAAGLPVLRAAIARYLTATRHADRARPDPRRQRRAARLHAAPARPRRPRRAGHRRAPDLRRGARRRPRRRRPPRPGPDARRRLGPRDARRRRCARPRPRSPT